eukprot:6203695-Pleurochrysis_carterae.AAC.1
MRARQRMRAYTSVPVCTYSLLKLIAPLPEQRGELSLTHTAPRSVALFGQLTCSSFVNGSSNFSQFGTPSGVVRHTSWCCTDGRPARFSSSNATTPIDKRQRTSAKGEMDRRLCKQMEWWIAG